MIEVHSVDATLDTATFQPMLNVTLTISLPIESMQDARLSHPDAIAKLHQALGEQITEAVQKHREASRSENEARC